MQAKEESSAFWRCKKCNSENDIAEEICDKFTKQKRTGIWVLASILLLGALLITGTVFFLSNQESVTSYPVVTGVPVILSTSDGPWSENQLKADFKVSDYKYNFFKMGTTTIQKLPAHVIFVDTLEELPNALEHRFTVEDENVKAAWDVSEAQDGSVWAWYMEPHPSDCVSNCKSKCNWILYIGAEGGVNGSSVSADMFEGFSGLKFIDFRNCLYTTK